MPQVLDGHILAGIGRSGEKDTLHPGVGTAVGPSAEDCPPLARHLEVDDFERRIDDAFLESGSPVGGSPDVRHGAVDVDGQHHILSVDRHMRTAWKDMAFSCHLFPEFFLFERLPVVGGIIIGDGVQPIVGQAWDEEMHILSFGHHPVAVVASNIIARTGTGPVGALVSCDDLCFLPRFSVICATPVVERILAIVLFSILHPCHMDVASCHLHLQGLGMRVPQDGIGHTISQVLPSAPVGWQCLLQVGVALCHRQKRWQQERD